MSNNHLTYFKVENFKRFESLEVKDLGQFNLIVGDNNVGKTCLLEALLVDKRFKNTLNHFYKLLVKRNLVTEPFIKYVDDNADYNFEKNQIAFYQRNSGKRLEFQVNDSNFSIENRKEELFNTQDEKIRKFIDEVRLFDYTEINKKSSNWLVFRVDDEIQYLADITSAYYEGFLNRPKESKIPNIPVLMLSDKVEDYIVPNYKLIFKEKNLEKRIFELIKNLFPNIEITAFQEIEGKLNIKTKSKDEYHDIREYGEGFLRCLYMMVLILSGESSKLMIDEIDTGVHFSKLKEVWKSVITLCQELNVQLFATTHSLECIETYIEASKELNSENDIRLIELKEYHSKIYSNTLRYDSVVASFDSKIELRGGDLFTNA